MDEPLIAGYVKLRNEIIRSGNVYRCLHNLQEFCDEIFVALDASWDGTDEYVKSIIPESHILQIDPKDQDFTKELKVKQELLELVHAHGPYSYIFWQDGDEVLEAKGVEEIRGFCRTNLKENGNKTAWAFHYLQIWRNSSWYRLDDQFNEGHFIKLWRYHPELSFEIINGTHNRQFPCQITTDKIDKAPWEVIHYGNYGVNLKWKCIQYSNGLGGVERHMNFENADYAEMDKTKYPSGSEFVEELEPKPKPFSPDYKDKLLKLNNLTKLEKTFCIILPTNNRAYTLERAIDSVLAQTYDKWILVVLDDASTDNTEELMIKYQDKDPRIFYAKYLEHRGGVAMNEIGMNIAVNTAEWWTRLGSDDWWEPHKLEFDAKAFEQGPKAVYGPFQVHREGKFQEIGNSPVSQSLVIPAFENGGFLFSWANCSVSCDILENIKSKFNNFCHPDLINMEDVLVNYRVSRLTNWIWRGLYKDDLIINPLDEQIPLINNNIDLIHPDAYWNVNIIGASANTDIYNKDRVLSTNLINNEKNIFNR